MENYGRLRKTIPKEGNSMSKFVREINETKSEDVFPSTTSGLFPSMSKLSLKRPPLKLAPIFNKDNFQRNKRKQSTVAVGSTKQFGEIEFLPIQKKKPLLERSQSLESTQSAKPLANSRTLRPEREHVFITGNVQFILKNYKLYPELKALYEVYGNVMKITKGKIKFEHNILMRNESGPILQGFYFDFENILVDFQTASLVRCVGHFNSQKRFLIHKIEQIQLPPQESELTRIQNVSAFALLQSQNERLK